MTDGFINTQLAKQSNDNDDGKFVNLKPKFIEPTGTKDVLSPPQKDNRPAISLKDQGGSKKIQDLLEQARQLSAKQAAPNIKLTKTKDRKTLLENAKIIKTTFCEAHIIEDDAEFIKIARSLSIFDKGAQNLLMANGGNKFLSQGLTLSQAWDALRKERQSNLLSPPGSAFDKRPKIDMPTKTYVQGIPTDEDLLRKVEQNKSSNKEDADDNV